MQILFWFSAVSAVYSYSFYPMILWCANRVVTVNHVLLISS